MIGIVTGSAPRERVIRVLDAAVTRLGLSHVVITAYEDAGLEAADWALLRGLKWTLAADPMEMRPDCCFRFPGGDEYPVTMHEINS